MPTHRLRYQNVFGTGARPYLLLHVTGPTGNNGPIWGLIDSGADRTSLPVGFASLMGYTGRDLTQAKAGVADGSEVPVQVANRAAHAYVVGLPEPVFQINPVFIPGATDVLWGRADLFNVFRITFDEPAQVFELSY